jgi:hypothetical protein
MNGVIDLTEKKRPYIPQYIKNTILRRQNGKCANIPMRPALNLQDYICLLWQTNDGKFDEAGYNIDHIVEYSDSYNNHISNLQALCPNCHAVKTKRFMAQKLIDGKGRLNSQELEDNSMKPKKRRLNFYCAMK